MDPLPVYEGKFFTADELLAKIKQGEAAGCLDPNGNPLLTIVDYRTEIFLKTDESIPSIKTNCRTVRCLLDDLRDPEIRNQVPKEGLVVLLCETGNRDDTTMRYLSKYGYTSVVGLRFGMRGWIKQNYPVDITE
ncbi:MAG: rhodanese-like domain-containing protein [Desulfobacterales bacterium]|nr:MAG: rhodanese-like domain-containing protein [Desulfobacterales bacterium]